MKKHMLRWLALGIILSQATFTLNAQSKEEGSSPSITGSGDLYKTTITETTKGELKPEDARQLSVLGARILTHIHNANHLFDAENPDQAKVELAHAQTLVKIIRDMLPITAVSTVITDAQGKEVYRYEDRVQSDSIPIVEGLINMQVVQPIVEAKKDEAALKGLQLANADLVHTAILLDLDFVEAKISQAIAHAKDPDKAHSALLSASADGVRFTSHREDHPLVSVQSALWLAEQQVREQKFEGAKANLQIARVQLEAYRTFTGDADPKNTHELESEIISLEDKLREPGAADKIRGFWNRVSPWFSKDGRSASENGGKGAEVMSGKK